MANVSSSNGLEKRPKLRFPGFDEPWKSKPFSSLYKYVNEKNDGSFSVDSIISVANMYFKPDARITDMEYLKTYNIFKLGDIAFEGNMSKDFSFGRFVENTIGDGIVSHVFVVFRPINNFHNFDYWKYAINNENVMGRILARCTKKTTMMTNLVTTDFLTQKIYCPSLEEQAHIASFLSLIDQRIRKQKELLNALKKYKRGVVQQVFSERNENKRTRYPEWKLSSLGEYFTEQTIRTSNSSATPLVSLTVENGITPKTERYYREFLVTKEGDNYKAIKPGWFAYNPMNAHLGAIAPNHLGYTAAVSGYYNIFSVNEIDTVDFWEEYLTSYPMLIHYKLIATGSLIEKQRVHYSQFVGIRRKLPSLEERKHLSKIFQALNAKITNAESMEHQLIKLRTSLLQQLFI